MTAGPEESRAAGTASVKGLRLTVGPPASGKTTAMVAVAREACTQGRRVWWLSLPHQRPYVFRRVTSGGAALLGLEVMSAQQAFYRVLSALTPDTLRPLLVGTARIVRVAEALREVTTQVPSPGEAKLFAAAIAEAKRYEVPPASLESQGTDAEKDRLAKVYSAYEGSKEGFWDYDDVRSVAARLVEDDEIAGILSSPAARAAAGLPDLVIVDGWRELGPLDWRFLQGLARRLEVHVTLPEAPSDTRVDSVLSPAPEGTNVERYAAVNPIQEARWVLRSLKRDLGGGHDPLDLAVVAPRAMGDALLALADEYGVPFMDERGSALADSPAGRTLLDLLELPDSPTPTRLLAVPELVPVATLALRLGVTGRSALERVAKSLGMHQALERWLAHLSHVDEPVEWTRSLIDEVLTLTQPDLPAGFAERVLAAAQHAAHLDAGESFRTWLAALLRDVRAPKRLAGGVSLLTADLASGRRFVRCYVMGANVGAYGAGEREDYFVPDEHRSHLAVEGSLPRRFAGGDDIVVAELLSRGDTTVITAASAGTEGKLVPDERLVGDPKHLTPLPELPAGSRLELREADVYQPDFALGDPMMLSDAYGSRRPDAEWLRSYAECAFRAWGEKVVLARRSRKLIGDIGGQPSLEGGDPSRLLTDPPPPAERELLELLEPARGPEAEWYDLVRDLGEDPQLTDVRLSQLIDSYPWAADWLEAQRETLMSLSWRPNVPEVGVGTGRYEARLHAGRRDNAGRTATIFRFVEPAPPDWDGQRDDWAWGREKLRGRWSEYLALHNFLEHRTRPARYVEVVVWPVLGEPITVERSSKSYTKGRVDEAVAGVEAAMAKLTSNDVSPTPGYWCGDCRLFYVCRMGQRG